MDFRYAPPGIVPSVILLLFIPLAAALFVTLPTRRALLFTMLIGSLFMPERVDFDLPLIPPLGKHEFACLLAFVGCWVREPSGLAKARIGRGIDILIFIMIISAAITAFVNPEELINGPTRRPGLGARDALSMAVREILEIALPFILGRAYIRTSKEADELMRLMLGFGFVYSLLMLVELRMSPQLHRWVYGYHAHDFAQTIRAGGGYRPTVFLEHGLAVGLFAAIIATLAAAYSRVRRVFMGLPGKLWTIYFSAILVLTKSAGATIFGALFVPLALWFKPRKSLLIGALLSLSCFAYPVAKLVKAFPEQEMIAYAASYSEERARSLSDRFYNDEMLIERAKEKLYFGWGSFGRNRIFNEQGEDISVTDGYWIIQVGTRGIVGLFCMFGLLLFPVFAARRSLRRIAHPKSRMLLNAVALMVLIYVLDLLPNGMYTNLPFFFSGALLGLARGMPKEQLKSSIVARTMRGTRADAVKGTAPGRVRTTV